MPYNAHQDFSPYYTCGLETGSTSSLSSSNCSSSSSLNSSPPPQHLNQQQNLHLHPHQQQQQQQQQVKLTSMESSSSLSPLSSSSSPSSSLSSYPNNIGSSFSGALFTQSEEDVDMQPLDLSVRSGREEQAAKRSGMAEHKSVCLVRSCVCNLGNARNQRLSPYPMMAPGVARSPNPRLSSSPLNRTDSPFYTQRRTPSPAYYSGGVGSSTTASSFYHLPPPPPLTATTTTSESSSFQILTTSDSVLNGIPNSSGLFRPYDDHIDSDLNKFGSSPTEDIQQQHQSHSLPPPPPQQQQQQQEEDEEPTYMDLDSATPKSLYPKPHKDFINRGSSSIHSEQSMSQIEDLQRGGPEGRAGQSSENQESNVLSTPSSRAGCDSTVMKPSPYYGGNTIPTISHTSSPGKVEDFQNGVVPYGMNTIVSTSTDLVDNQQQEPIQQQNHSQQMYHPDSSTPASGVSSSTGHLTTLNAYPNNPQPFPYPAGPLDHSSSQPAATDARFPIVPTSEQQQQHHHIHQQQQPQQQQRQSPTSGQPDLCHSSRNSPSNKENTARSKNKSISSPHVTRTANFFQLPVTTSLDANDMVDQKNRRNGERRYSGGLHQPSSATENIDNKEDSNKISLLDFWISKMLMERSADIPPTYKPSCNVDYVRTVDGEKKIRLRLVDLIELQVEQSLKA